MEPASAHQIPVEGGVGVCARLRVGGPPVVLRRVERGPVGGGGEEAGNFHVQRELAERHAVEEQLRVWGKTARGGALLLIFAREVDPLLVYPSGARRVVRTHPLPEELGAVHPDDRARRRGRRGGRGRRGLRDEEADRDPGERRGARRQGRGRRRNRRQVRRRVKNRLVEDAHGGAVPENRLGREVC